MLGIVIIAYNTPDLLRKQVEMIRRFCKDEHEIVVIDNSSDGLAAKAIKYHSEDMNCVYIRSKSASFNSSDSHSFAANLSYSILKDRYSYFLYLDHDCFPIKDFSVEATLGEKIAAGIGQEKHKLYLWPGCLMIRNIDEAKNLLDFSVSPGLDTGGGLYVLIERFGKERFIFFDEQHCQNPGFNKSKYNFYSLINNGQFLHFINGSNWSGSNDHQERLNSLINVLDSMT